jgi:hypothetical protein
MRQNLGEQQEDCEVALPRNPPSANRGVRYTTCVHSALRKCRRQAPSRRSHRERDGETETS